MQRKIAYVITAVIVIAVLSYVFAVHITPLLTKPPKLSELITKYYKAKYEGFYKVNGKTIISSKDANLTTIFSGDLRYGQDTINRTYLGSIFNVRLKSLKLPFEFEFTLPVQLSTLRDVHGNVKTCINMTFSFNQFKTRIARCNKTVAQHEKLKKIEEIQKNVLNKIANNSWYLGTYRINGIESYCYSSVTDLNLTELVLLTRGVQKLPPFMRIPKEIELFTINISKICLTRNGELTLLTILIYNKRIEKLKLILNFTMIATSIKSDYFDEDFWLKLQSLPS